MKTYEEQLAATEAAEAAAAFDRAAQFGYREVLRVLPQISPSQATYNALARFCAPGPIDLQQVIWGLQPGNGTLLEDLRGVIRTDAEAREAFAEVVAQGAGSIAEQDQVKRALLANFKVSEHFADTTLAATPLHTTESLARKAEQATANREARSLKPHQLREIVRSGRQDFTNVVPASLTRKAFAALDTKGMRKALEIYGATNLNAKWTAEEKR